MKWKSKTDKRVRRFGATIGNRQLSNFAKCGVMFRDPFGKLQMYSSSEAVWQGSKARSERVSKMFLQDGALGSLAAAAFKKFFPRTDDEKLAKKLKYWSRGESVGILAKMASNKKHAKKLGIEESEYNYEIEHLPEDELEERWLPILRAKYAPNTPMRKTLLETGEEYLLEFDRGATRRDSFWGAIDDEDGNITGNNFMGRMLMKVRDEIRSEEASAEK